MQIIPDDLTDDKNNIFCLAAIANKQQGLLHTAATRALLAMLRKGNQYFMIANDYNTIYIDVHPMPPQKDSTISHIFDISFKNLTEKGHKPTFYVTDNQDTIPLKAYLQQNDYQWPLVEPSNHHVNAAEYTIQTFKNHFIRGLCSTYHNWPIQLWDQMTDQALITLNLCQTA